MPVPIAIATAPWWLTPAVNTAGIGLIMLNDYINKNKINLNPFKSQELDIDDVNWMKRDLSDTSNHPLGALVSNRANTDSSVVKTDTAFNASPPNNNNNGKKQPDYQPSGQARWTALGELLGKLTSEKENKDFQVGGKYGPSEEALIDLADQETLYNRKGEYIGGVLPEGDGIDHRATWLYKTRNSPAAKAGHSEDARWGTYLGNQAWRKDHGRSYDTSIDHLLKPSSENKRGWNVFGNEMVFDK
jgi:hypothetical protein